MEDPLNNSNQFTVSSDYLAEQLKGAEPILEGSENFTTIGGVYFPINPTNVNHGLVFVPHQKNFADEYVPEAKAIFNRIKELAGKIPFKSHIIASYLDLDLSFGVPVNPFTTFEVIKSMLDIKDSTGARATLYLSEEGSKGLVTLANMLKKMPFAPATLKNIIIQKDLLSCYNLAHAYYTRQNYAKPKANSIGESPEL